MRSNFSSQLLSCYLLLAVLMLVVFCVPGVHEVSAVAKSSPTPTHAPTYVRVTADPNLPGLTAAQAYDLMQAQASLWHSNATIDRLLGVGVALDGTADTWYGFSAYPGGNLGTPATPSSNSALVTHKWVLFRRVRGVFDAGELTQKLRPAAIRPENAGRSTLTMTPLNSTLDNRCPLCNPAKLYPLTKAVQTAKQLIAVTNPDSVWAKPKNPIFMVSLIDGQAFGVKVVWVFDFLGLLTFYGSGDDDGDTIVLDAQTGKVIFPVIPGQK